VLYKTFIDQSPNTYIPVTICSNAEPEVLLNYKVFWSELVWDWNWILVYMPNGAV
jgi:hypothetical protein